MGEIRAFIDSSNEFNIMTLVLVAKLGFSILLRDISMQKIDSTALKTYSMVIAKFLIKDNIAKIRLFEETFLLANTSTEIGVEMPFPTLCNTKFELNKANLTWKAYIRADNLSITSRVKFIDKHKFVNTTLDKNTKTFFIHVAVFEPSRSAMLVYSSQPHLFSTL